AAKGVFGKDRAAHVDDHVEFDAAQVADAFREVVAQIDTFFLHRLDRVGRDAAGRAQARAGRNHDIPAIGPPKAFGHLATAGISNANEQDPFQRRAHNFSRKSRCTRESRVNSGWNVATRCFPSSTNTGSPLYRASTCTFSPTLRMIGARMKTAS